MLCSEILKRHVRDTDMGAYIQYLLCLKNIFVVGYLCQQWWIRKNNYANFRKNRTVTDI